MTLPARRGGLCGERKIETLELVQGTARALLARYIGVEAHPNAASAIARSLASAGLDYPVVVRTSGTGVRLLHGPDDLQLYLSEFLPGERIVLQQFVPDEGKAVVFYVRHPDEACGQITSIA